MKKSNDKVKPTTVYFLGNPDQLHFISSMMKAEDAYLLVDNPDKAEHILATEGMSDLLKAHQHSSIIVDLSLAQEKPESAFKSVIEKIQSSKRLPRETSNS